MKSIFLMILSIVFVVAAVFDFFYYERGILWPVIYLATAFFFGQYAFKKKQ